MMDSREIVTRAIEFKSPERLPVVAPLFGISDVRHVGWNQTGTGSRAYKRTLDEWGCEWVRSEIDNMGQVKGHPLADWSDLAHYHWPEPDDPAFYSGMEAKFEGTQGMYIQTGIFMLLFERMHALRGFQAVLEDLYLERERVEMLADRIVEIDLRIIANIASRFPGMIQGFTFTDDWGSQKDAFINPHLWREFFKPRYEKILNACHAAGWHTWMHSCGKINKLIPQFIAAGVDVLNLEQPRLLDIPEVGAQFAGKVAFATGCDIQHTLPFEGPEGIRYEAQLLLECWGTPQGGFILQDDENDQDLHTPLEKKKIALQAFMELDRWKESP